MKHIDPDRVFTEYRDNIQKDKPILGRKYTMTHSDETGDLFVTVGMDFAKDKFSDVRDEVLLEFVKNNSQLILSGEVLITNPNSSMPEEKRYDIFKREMPLALEAIRFGDRALFDSTPLLDDVPVFIQFISEDPRYHRLYQYGTIGNYKITLI